VLSTSITIKRFGLKIGLCNGVAAVGPHLYTPRFAMARLVMPKRGGPKLEVVNIIGRSVLCFV